ncbi:hypothetical protein [uncultured Brachyspira sp.]|uniref:hypothetical protein n=1 Tax=uncultured Brachyspira sp. TaxID=221953 RepID=UPI00260AC0D8|nr:hypothetical protein [uncultured Brachyspira sp.]
MFELKVREEERDGFIYKIMDMDLGDKKEEIYIKLPISEKQYLTDLYDPYVVFNIFKMMSIGGECRIRGKVSKSLLDNLEMFVGCYKVWLPKQCKDITIIADEEVDEPKKLNNDAVMCFSGGLDSVATLYRHCNGLAGRNNRNIKKLLAISGNRGVIENVEEVHEVRGGRIKKMVSDMGLDVTFVDTNYYETDTIFSKLETFLVVYVAIMMLYQDTYNNLIIASDQFIYYDSINVDGRGSNPIVNKLLQSNRFRLITDGEFITRIDKINTIKNWKLAIYNMLACDAPLTKDNKCCGTCNKCLFTKLDLIFSDANADLNLIYENTSTDLNNYEIIGDNYIFYEEILYYDKYKKKVLDDESRKKIKYLIEKNRHPEYVKKINDLEKSNVFNLLTIFNFKLFAINNNTGNITITIFGIKITIKK